MVSVGKPKVPFFYEGIQNRNLRGQTGGKALFFLCRQATGFDLIKVKLLFAVQSLHSKSRH